MIDRKDLRVGLVTSDGKVITAIGEQTLLYKYERLKLEFDVDINEFCSVHSIKKEKVEIITWANICESGNIKFFYTEREAKLCAPPDAVAIAVKMRGEYEI